MTETEKRFRYLQGVDRLNEELLCLLSWLSTNRYEEKAIEKVKADFKLIVNQFPSKLEYCYVGSTECYLQVLVM